MKRILCALVLAGCVNAPSSEKHDHEHASSNFVRHALEHRVDFDHTVRQVGIMYDAKSPLFYRTDGSWNAVPVTWNEGDANVAVIPLDGTETHIEFRADKPFENATFALHEEQVGRNYTAPSPTIRTTKQMLAPADLVVSRAEWGARDPDKLCGEAHSPSRISVHHTSIPADDGGDAAQRVRQMQAFHIDDRGWCDIGYHFIVAQSGVIYQGRSDEERTGAHVGGANTDNVGISLIGDYEVNQPEDTQLDSAKQIMNWIATTYDIPFERETIKGHQEWPGQSTDCPGQNIIAMLDEIIAESEALSENPVDNCDALGTEGGIIDNDGNCFRAFGPAEFWRRVDGQGHAGSLLWTNATEQQDASNYARWTVNVATPGKYTVEYNSVDEFAVFNSARFGVAHAGMEENLTVDLAAGSNGWNLLGEYEFDGSDDEWISVYDNTPLPTDADQHIIADAIQLTLVEPTEPIEPNNQTPNNTPSENNGNAPNNDKGENNDQNNGDPLDGADGDDVNTNDGCATTDSKPSPLLAVLFGVWWFRRRRQR